MVRGALIWPREGSGDPGHPASGRVAFCRDVVREALPIGPTRLTWSISFAVLNLCAAHRGRGLRNLPNLRTIWMQIGVRNPQAAAMAARRARRCGAQKPLPQRFEYKAALFGETTAHLTKLLRARPPCQPQRTQTDRPPPPPTPSAGARPSPPIKGPRIRSICRGKRPTQGRTYPTTQYRFPATTRLENRRPSGKPAPAPAAKFIHGPKGLTALSSETLCAPSVCFQRRPAPAPKSDPSAGAGVSRSSKTPPRRPTYTPLNRPESPRPAPRPPQCQAPQITTAAECGPRSIASEDGTGSARHRQHRDHKRETPRR